MQSETLPAAKQPDEPPNVMNAAAASEPCHTGTKALSCGLCVSLMEMADLQAQTLHCVSCEAPFGQPHDDTCRQQS